MPQLLNTYHLLVCSVYFTNNCVSVIVLYDENTTTVEKTIYREIQSNLDIPPLPPYTAIPVYRLKPLE